MNKIQSAFTDKNAFIAYIMAGDPDLLTTEEIIVSMEAAGADLVEIGIPFSDPIAEGDVIQRASQRALRSGTTPDAIFSMIERLKSRVSIPLVLMTYANPVFHYGYEAFFTRCEECGVSGIIIPDIPYEEQGELKPIANAHQVEVITLVAPTSIERITTIARDVQGFLYLVSSMGVTGMRQSIDSNCSELVARIREVTEVPVAIGFGIHSPEQVKQFLSYSDGVIVGSAIVKIIEQYGKMAGQPVADYVKKMTSVK